MSTTFIMAPGACRTQGRSRTDLKDLRDLKDLKDLRDGIPGASFGLIKIIVSAVLGEKITRIQRCLISTAEIT